jgi:peptidoglycan/LPS O-acetylase OafA/YrhL
MAGNHRIFGLDLLRTIAILSVVYAHGASYVPTDTVRSFYQALEIDGVSLFFVLSGFLIGRILLSSFFHTSFTASLLSDFLIRRWFRTLPNYFLVLGALTLAIPRLSHPLPDDWLWHFFFLQNFSYTQSTGLFPESWSLAVEEWFYLTIPLCLYLASKIKWFNRHSIVLTVIVLVIAAVTIFRFYRAYHYGYVSFDDWDINLRKQVVTRLDSLMFGLLAAYMAIRRIDIWGRHPNCFFWIGVAAIVFDTAFFQATQATWYLNYFRLSIVPIGTMLMLPKLAAWKRPNDGITKFITFISLISYSMYLLNLKPFGEIVLQILARLAPGWADANNGLIYLLYWAFTISASAFLYQFYEKPMTKLRDHWPTILSFVQSHRQTSVFGKSALPPH